MQLIKRKSKVKQNENYCSTVKNRLPYPIECTTNKKLGVAECVKCEKEIIYYKWKQGFYNDLILKYNK